MNGNQPVCGSNAGLPDGGAKCPTCGSRSRRVGPRTVAALTWKPLPLSKIFWLCRERNCPVVYFGVDGVVFTLEDLKVQPGFKGDGDWVCYCFGVSRTDLVSGDSTRFVETVRDAARQGLCACEVRNPSGNCCLGEVSKLGRVPHK